MKAKRWVWEMGSGEPETGDLGIVNSSVSDGIGCSSHFSFMLLLLAPFFGLGLAGCGGGQVQRFSPTIVSPGPSDNVSAVPVKVLVALNDQPLSSLKVELNGADITSNFTDVLNGVAVASITNGVSVGDNRLSATAVNYPPALSTFSYTPPIRPEASAPPLPDTVSIQTQVQTTNPGGQKTNGVEIGQTIYANPGSASDWQLLLLSRSTLQLIANKNYTINPNTKSYGPLDQMIVDITPGGSLIQQCGQPGCLMVLQGPVNSAGFQPFPCGFVGTPADIVECNTLQNTLASVGATLTSTYISSNGSSGAGYSFVGNVGKRRLSAGVNFERITCANSTGCLSLPVPDPTDSNHDFINGIAPNGVDGVMPSLAGTADSGTTAIPATPSTPAMTIYNNGAMGGLLVSDNNTKYTFTYAAPPVRFQMGPAPDDPSKHIVILQIPAASSMKFPDGTTTLQARSAAIPANQTGGFHLVVLNATTLQPVVNATYVTNPVLCPSSCQSPEGTTIYSLDQLPEQLQRRFPSRGYLWFLGSFGSVAHDFPVTSTGANAAHMQDIWDRVAQSVQDLGGTYTTFAMLDNPALAYNNYTQYGKNKVPTDDDYNMVGQLWINASGVANPYAAEASKAISRQTSLYPVAGNMQGILKKSNDGFYQASQHSQYQGIVTVPGLDLLNASYLPRIPWPLTGANDPIGPKNAYQWISEQLLQCNIKTSSGCGDIRSAYNNLNLSADSWQDFLSRLAVPSDCTGTNNPCGFTGQDFATAKTQLLEEFYDLSALRGLARSLTSQKAAEGPDFNSVLTAVSDNVLADIPVTTTLQIGPNTTNDILNVISDASGYAGMIPEVGSGISATTQTGIGLYEAITDDGTTIIDPNGIALKQQEQDFTEISSLANRRADQYAGSFTSIGVTFGRISSDWRRMQTAAAPVIDNTLQFNDQVLGQYLIGYNLALRRSLYAALMPFNYYTVHYRYAAPGLHSRGSELSVDWYPQVYNNPNRLADCETYLSLPTLLDKNPDSFGFWQGALIDGPGSTVDMSTAARGHTYPLDAWWDVWFVGQKQAYDNVSDGLYDAPECPAHEPDKYLPQADFFKKIELFIPIGTDADALGLYKPWFLGRGSLVRLRAVDTTTIFWKNRQLHGQLDVGDTGHWTPDPDNY